MSLFLERRNSLSLFLLSGCLLLFSGTAIKGQDITNTRESFPPTPPPIPSLDSLPSSGSNNSRIIQFYPPGELPRSTPQPPPPVPQENWELPLSIEREPNTVAPQVSREEKDTYRVEVPGDTPIMLAQVKRIEPTAFVRSGEGTIQAGLFSEENNARERVEELEGYGLKARIIQVEPEAVSFLETEELVRDRGYYLIIPAQKEEFGVITSLATDLGIEENQITTGLFDKGSHVAIGPFAYRRDAELWNGQLRYLQMDARIYFNRRLRRPSVER